MFNFIFFFLKSTKVLIILYLIASITKKYLDMTLCCVIVFFGIIFFLSTDFVFYSHFRFIKREFCFGHNSHQQFLLILKGNPLNIFTPVFYAGVYFNNFWLYL